MQATFSRIRLMCGYSVIIACIRIIATRQNYNLYLATFIRNYIVSYLYGFTLPCSVFRVFHIGIITTSYNSYFVLAIFCPFRVRVCSFRVLCVDIISYIQDTHSRRSRDRFYLYYMLQIFSIRCFTESKRETI